MKVRDLGTMAYQQAWALQEQAHADVVTGGQEQLLFVEHPPVITFGRRPGVAQHLIASQDQLAKLNVEVVQSDRGGDITFHGPGQLVVYPIIRLADHRLLVGSYMRKLQQIVIATLQEFGIAAQLDPSAVGVWAPSPADQKLAKICALGVRIRRGVSMHGIALNVTTDLRYFELIVPCGLVDRPVTSMAQLLGDQTPAIARVKDAAMRQFLSAFASPGLAIADPAGPQ